MFSKKFQRNFKRTVSAVLTVCMVLSMFTVLTLTAASVVSAEGATETEDAIFIAKAGTNNLVAAFIPVDTEGAYTGTQYFKLEFKCNMLSKTLPILGTMYPTGNAGRTDRDLSWMEQGNVTVSDGVCTAYFYVNFNTVVRDQGENSYGYREFYITIGNAEFDQSGSSSSDYDASFIFSDVKLYTCDDISGTNTGSTNLLPAWGSDIIDFNGTYFFKGRASDGNNQADGMQGAIPMKWQVCSRPQYAKHIVVPSDYNTSSSYSASNFTKTDATTYTREYYTNADYSDLYFAALKNSNNAGFEVISKDINEKMIIIEANHEDEEDYRGTGSERVPSRNKPANIFIPLSLEQYHMDRTGRTNGTGGENALLHVTFKAVRLEGDGSPVIGWVAGKKAGTNGDGKARGSEGLPKVAENATIGDFWSNSSGSHNKFYDTDGSTPLNCTYDPSTGEYSGWIRVRPHDNDYATRWGKKYVLTIGNAEYAYKNGRFDTTEFNTSFAISNIQVDMYSADNPSGSNYNKTTTWSATDIAPDLYADNIDSVSAWAYRFTGESQTNNSSNHAHDPIRASQYKWSRDGNVGMVHIENLSACMKDNHTLTHSAATETTCEYWSCATCGKIYADAYGMKELSSAAATQKMIVVSPTSGTATAFIPLKVGGFSNNQLFKFTCKVKCDGSEIPTVSTVRPSAEGYDNICNPTTASSKNGFAVYDYSYDSDTCILTAYIKAWMSPNYNKTYYPYQRYNPLSGADFALIIGNAQYISTGVQDKKSDTEFAITAPELYMLDVPSFADGDEGSLSDVVAMAQAADTVGENLIAPITDKTVDFDSYHSTSFTASNNATAAKRNIWQKMGSDLSAITVTDIPAGFFDGEVSDGLPKMLRLAGANSTTNQQALNLETHLQSNKTYQFDIDYRAFGGVDAHINIQTRSDSSDGYKSDLVTYTNTSSNVSGAHRSVRFTMPSDARGDNNFKTYIGQKYPLKNTGVVFFANASLREVSGNTLGENIFTNGDFHEGVSGTVTGSNASSAFTGWGINNVLNYPSITLMPIPDGFFEGNEVSGDETVAVKMTGGDYVELQFKAELKPDTYYGLSFDYRNLGAMPRLDIRAKGTVTSTKKSSHTANTFRMDYELYSDSSNTPYGDTDPNTRIRLKFGASSSNKVLYINNVQLFELDGTGGNAIGTNLVGNLNAILDGSFYSELVNVGDTADVTFNQDASTNIKRNLANGWFAATSTTTAVDASLIKVPADFFTYYSYDKSIAIVRDTILGFRVSDGINPYYNPNNDDVWSDARDLVNAKMAAIDSLNAVENSITINSNDISQYRLLNDGASSSAFTKLNTVISEFMDISIQTTTTIPADGKVIRLAADPTMNPNQIRIYLDGNTLNIVAFRAEFTSQAVNKFASLLSASNNVRIASGFDRTYSVDTVSYTSAEGTKRLISDTDGDAIRYNVGDTAKVRITSVDLDNAKILTGVPYLKLHTYNEATGAASDTYVTQTNGVYEFNVTASQAGFVFWYALACDSNKSQISSFATVDDVSGNKYNCAGSVGFGTSTLLAKTAKPSDFNTYWQGVAAGIGSTSGAILTESSADTGYKAYLVKIPCGTDINNNQGYATGYLTYPESASSTSKIKMRVDFQSYGVSAPKKIYAADTAVFTVCAHSMDITSESSISAYNSYKNSNGFNYTASTVEGTYFYQMIRRDLVASKFMIDHFGSAGNGFWNGTDFSATGGSMGGFQSTAVAALLKYATTNGEGITHLNIEIPYMCDLNGENNGRMPRYWGTRYTNSLKYFDTTYFGSLVTCKTTIFAGLGDSICPASGTMSLYNTIPATDKKITYRQGATHSSYGSGTEFVMPAAN